MDASSSRNGRVYSRGSAAYLLLLLLGTLLSLALLTPAIAGVPPTYPGLQLPSAVHSSGIASLTSALASVRPAIACQCLSTWIFQGAIFHSCLSTGWCLVPTNCNQYAGTTSDSLPPNQKWAYCNGTTTIAPSPPPPKPPPSPRPPTPQCDFYQRTEDADLIVRTGGVQIWTCRGAVVPSAVRIARRIMEGMMQTSPQVVLDNLASYRPSFCIIGRNQRLTDLPPFAYLAKINTSDGRSYGDLAGVGAVRGAPETAVSEQNLLWLDIDPYTTPSSKESIALHEFAHTIQDLGLGNTALKASEDAFSASLVRRMARLQSLGSTPYAWTNYLEFWAVLSEAWFDATTRTDINLGVTSCGMLQAQEPEVAVVFQQQAYGASSWTYAGDPQLPHTQTKTGPAVGTRRHALGAGSSHYVGAPREGLKAAADSRRPEQIWVRP